MSPNGQLEPFAPRPSVGRRRRGRLVASLLLAALGVASSVLAQGDPVTLHTSIEPEAAAPGSRVAFVVVLDIDEGWHTQSHQPSQPALIATRLVLDEVDGVSFGEALYPPGEDVDLEGLGTLSLYSGETGIAVPAQLSGDLASGALALSGKLTYQACDDARCLFPKTVPVRAELQVSSDAPVAQVDASTFVRDGHAPSGKGKAAEPSAVTSSAGAAPEGGDPETSFPLFLGGVFLLGLGLNLTPCVYPVIAVTLGFFGNQSSDRGRRALLSLLYSLGIVASFTGLFLFAGLTGSLFGSWLQSTWVLAAIAILMLVLAASAFGFGIQFQAPSWMLNRVGGGRSGLLGAAVMGLTMGVVAAPCVAPLIAGLLLWVGQQASLSAAAITGLSLSVGLALPYFLLGIFSSAITQLPKPGDWRVWVEHLFGFVLLGAALYFISPLLPSDWFLPVFVVLLVVAGVWLGLLDKYGRSTTLMKAVRTVTLVACMGVALHLWNLYRAEPLSWEPYSNASLDAAVDRGTPVLIDFTADWCVPCKVLENGPFKDPEVIELAQGFVRLRVDLTEQGDGDVQDVVSRFEVPGPPAVVLLDADGAEQRPLRVVEVVSAEELSSRLRDVLDLTR